MTAGGPLLPPLLAILACGPADPGWIHTPGLPDAEDDQDTASVRPAPLAAADVLVVGAGASGLAAAVAARAEGAEVLVLEREAAVGGAGEHAAHLWAAGTAIQASAGVEDSAELALAEWEEFTRGEADHPLIQAFVEGSASTLDWLVEQGTLLDDSVHPMDHTGSAYRIHLTLSSPTAALYGHVEDAVRLETEVTGLVVDDGRVIGVETADGWYAAAAVVLATGGFGRDVDRVERARPELEAFRWYIEAWTGMTGSGHAIAEVVGVEPVHEERIGLHSRMFPDATLGHPEVMQAAIADALLVDATGARAPRGTDHELVELQFEAGPLWYVVDSEQIAALTFEGRGFNYDGDPAERSIDGPSYLEAAGLGHHETLADLATEAGLDPETVEATVARWNALIASGTDPDLGESMGRLTPIDAPPYAALPLVLSTTKSWGGVPLDEEARVLMPDGAPVPGLYAAGELAGFLGGADLGEGFNGSVTACYFVGRAAGMAAAREVQAR